jgi:hypothetical protein
VLPRLRPGVLVQIHDIFFPHEYPRDWVLDNRWYWTEQYLVQAFLAFNDRFRVELCESWLKAKAREALERALPGFARPEVNARSNALWIRRIK